MCGIAGTYRWPDGKDVTDRLTDVLAHRGPDGAGRYSHPVGDGEVHLGHRRLSIIDLSETGAQPMVKDGLVLTYNGELYNAPELRAELEAAGVRFRGTSDSEVLLESWRRWGTDCLPRLRGMFAFGIFDERTGDLVLVRDQLGIKPLFLLRRGEGLVFASELKALAAVTGGSLEVDHAALVASLLYYWVPDSRCAFREAEKLPPGSWLRIRPDGRVQRGRFWNLRDVAAEGRARARAGERPDLAAIVEESTRKHLLADVPVATFLSGGLDSSWLTALAARHQPGISAYTIGFRAEDARFEAMPDDLRYARQVAERFGVELHEIEIAPNVLDLLPQMTYSLDEPIGDPAAINTFLICQAAREAGVKVMLSGMGADELFAGYRKHLANVLALRYQRVPGPVRRGVSGIVDRLPVATSRRGLRSVRFAKRFLSFADLPEETAFRRSYTMYDQDELLALVDPDLAGTVDDVLTEHADTYEDNALDDFVNRMCLADARMFLPGLNLTYTDRSSMAASTEVRVPYVDVEVVRAAFAVPGDRKIVKRQGKAVLKEAATSILPREIVYRPKGLFSAPLRAWMSRDLAPLVREVVNDGELVRSGFLRRDALNRMVAEDAAGQQDFSKHLWHVLTLEYWYRDATSRSDQSTRQTA
ncbi:MULTISPECIES: asparagine synthase (glutamine-hydrolyzing) [Streptomyces]|uniref:asparagine synthase (glutamine-hydrolyzing) n=1 Tax=Streptomyces scabiei (strain 87.22) TaxID=680198 RepID=C9YYZ7_STRSW|nr:MULTISPECIES: asparagine synthase (glutamine-hydrolyzing) [Streptomyces]MBP5860653.1 asparagine synthase (glutamine-hydrolyzing) [Streptomyces sp. LBUM 1484]MBP5870356.1 asparagine synthase (glutamine-hydrolyzing) [Streptomyces sp. LBUM 1485]MBP5909006.1 asparagine synthase (glutamine-hydrolyzing) [Streptomyces sp. LBUM 1478]MBP5928162.1 asparagine synthase (glutamine-hydrolyzing) [Streptomyces sp. LBUM 1479]KFG09577.1 asparagine synthase [Streptomyces scabiei]